EALNPSDFGLDRRLDIGSRYTGRHAVGQRATELGMHLSDEETGQLTNALKARAETGALSLEEVDIFIRTWHEQLRAGV
ncbi:MAG: homocitrate synthase, partial [Ktedonobacteraceae bacterium]